MSILDALPHTVTIKIRTRTADSLGGSKDTFTVVSEDVACWRQLASDREIHEFDKRGISVTDKVYFTSDPGVGETHILMFGSDILEVRSYSAPDASAGMGVVWRVMCELTTTGSTENL